MLSFSIDFKKLVQPLIDKLFPKPMTFEVGVGLTSQQKTKAEQKVKTMAEVGKTLPESLVKPISQNVAWKIQSNLLTKRKKGEQLTSYERIAGKEAQKAIEEYTMSSVVGFMGGMKFVSPGEAEQLIAKATNLTRKDLQTITSGGTIDKVKLDAYKTMTKYPELRDRLSTIAKNEKIPLINKITDYVKDLFPAETVQKIKPVITPSIKPSVGAIIPLETETNIVKNYLNTKVSTTLEKQTLPFKERVYTAFNKLYTATIDRFNPITKIAKEATKTGKLQVGENPELLARRYLGIKGITESKIFWKTTDLLPDGSLKITGDGLSKILEPVKNNVDDLRAFMVAQRDLELAGRGMKGTTPKESQVVINTLSKQPNFPQLQKISQGVRDWANRALLNPLKEVGAISDETYNQIIKSNQFYVPFQRVMEEIETQGFIPVKTNLFTPKGIPIKGIKGSTKKIIDPLESLITNVYKITDFVERERVAKSVVNLRNLSPELSEMIKPVAPKMVPVAQEGIKTIFRPSVFAPEKNTIQVFENGARKFYQVEPDLAQAMKGMSGSDMGIVMKLLSFPAKTLRAGATLSPEFIGRNPIRDQMSAFVYSKYGYIPGVDLVKGIWETIGKGDLFQKWLASGADQSMFVSLDRITTQKTLKDVLLKETSALSPQKALQELKTFVKSPLEPLRTLSTWMEKGTRVGAFGKAVKKGVPELKAGFEARDITLDFARMGSQTKPVNQIIAFWNANVQGIDKLARSFKEKPIQTTLKAIMGITIPSIGLYLSQKDNERFQEVPQWQKDLFWIIVPPGEKSPIIKIPKPFELGIIFGTVPEHILTWIDKNDPDSLKSIPSAIAKGASPGFVPTALLPILENTANYSFFRDRPILSERLANLPPELQTNTYTSETAKEIGKIIKKSPAKIENMVLGYFGGLGNYALDASDMILKKLGVVSPPPEPTKTAADIPFIKGFVVREPIGSNSESVNKFYDIVGKATQAYNAAKLLADSKSIDASAEYIKLHKEALLFKGLNKIVSDFSEINKKKRLIISSTTLLGTQKRQVLDSLDRLMTEIAQQTLIIINEIQ